MSDLNKEFFINILVNQHTLIILVLMVAVFILLRKKAFRHNMSIHIVRVLIAFFFLFLIGKLLKQLIKIHDISFVTTSEIDFLILFAIAALLIREAFIFADHINALLIKKGNDVTSAQIICRMIKIVSVICILLLLGGKFGLSFSGLLTFGGISGVAIGLAGKDILSNFFSGIMLYFDRPFNIGDWVRSPDRNIEGIVVEIGWRLTKIMTFENCPLYVPNYVFSSICVENPGRMLNWRIKASIGILCEDSSKIEVIVTQIKEMLKNNNNIDKSQSIIVNFDEIGNFSLNILVYCFAKTTVWSEWLQIQEDVYLKIIDIVQKNGSDLAYPTQKIFVDQNQKT